MLFRGRRPPDLPNHQPRRQEQKPTDEGKETVAIAKQLSELARAKARGENVNTELGRLVDRAFPMGVDTKRTR